MTHSRTPLFVFGTVAAIILLLLFFRAKHGGSIVGDAWKAPDIIVNTIHTDLPALQIPNFGGAYDWMQTTDLECGCDTGGTTFNPMAFESPSMPANPHSYIFIREVPAPPPVVYYYPAPPVVFATATFPGPQWWWGWRNMERVVYLSNGTVLNAGGMTRKFTLNGDDLIYLGMHYSHNAAKDVGL